MKKIPYEKKIWIYIAGVIIIWLGIVIGITIFTQSVEAFYIGWSDSFDSYADESLLNGQGGWMTIGDERVSNDHYFSTPNGIKRGSIEPIIDKVGEELDTGVLSFKFYDTGAVNGSALFLTNTDRSSGGFTLYILKEGETGSIFYDNTWAKRYTTGLAFNTWHTVYVEWNSTTRDVRIQVDALGWSEWFDLLTGYNYPVGGFSLRYGYGSEVFFDNFNIAEGSPQLGEARVFGVYPASGTEITDLNNTLTIEYEGLEGWDSLYVNLKNLETGIFTNTRFFEVSDIGGSGSLEINLLDFEIEKNGNWYLYANGVYQGYVYEGGFLKGTGFIWSEDLTDGLYFLNVNIEGLEPIFQMSDFNVWYSGNVEKFDEPTEMFTAIAGFFQPIFSTLGEFGNRITGYFETDKAYTQGFEIGKAIPMFSYYVGQIGVFIGGFPIINWLLIIILVLVGIFIFRTIMKFIPFLG